MTALIAIVFSLLAKFLLKNEPTTEQRPPNTQSKPPCPRCGSHHTIKNGSTHNGKPKCQCKDCGRQFVINPSKQPISWETKQLIDKLLCSANFFTWYCQSYRSKLVVVAKLRQ